MTYVDFTVVGRSSFPLDMLRHDQCWPRDSNDAQAIYMMINEETRRDRLDNDGPVRIRLCGRYTTAGYLYPTGGRWSSFGWSVDPDSVVYTK